MDAYSWYMLAVLGLAAVFIAVMKRAERRSRSRLVEGLSELRRWQVEHRAAWDRVRELVADLRAAADRRDVAAMERLVPKLVDAQATAEAIPKPTEERA